MLPGGPNACKKLAKGLDEVWVYFNNDAHGYAVKHALRLNEMLES